MLPKQNILTLIPQRPPFVMVSELVHSDETASATFFKIEGDNIFVTDGFFTEPGLIENIAQTAAARAGFLALSKDEPVAVGYIGAVQNLEITALPAVQKTIFTEIIIDNQVMNVLLITGIVKCDDVMIAKCNMKIFIAQK